MQVPAWFRFASLPGRTSSESFRLQDGGVVVLRVNDQTGVRRVASDDFDMGHTSGKANLDEKSVQFNSPDLGIVVSRILVSLVCHLASRIQESLVIKIVAPVLGESFQVTD